MSKRKNQWQDREVEFVHPFTKEPGIFDRMEDMEVIYKTPSGQEFVAVPTDGTWDYSHWKTYDWSEYKTRIVASSSGDSKEAERYRQDLYTKAQDLRNQYITEQKSLYEEAWQAILLISQWEHHNFQRKLGTRLGELYTNKLILATYFNLSRKVDHVWLRDLEFTLRQDAVYGRPPFWEQGSVCQQFAVSGRQDLIDHVYREYTEPEIWEGYLQIVRPVNPWAFWTLQFYREPRIKAGWAAFVGGGSVWKEWRMPVSLNNADTLLATVHPKVFIEFAKQIKSGELEGEGGPLVQDVRREILKTKEYKDYLNNEE